MAWVLDTYLTTVPPNERQRCIHVVTGKPVEAGGSIGRDKATGQGIVYMIEKWAKERDFALAQASCIIQGFGNVGSWAARLLSEHGVTLRAVEDVTGAVYSRSGIDPEDLACHVTRNGGVAGYPHASAIDHLTFLSTEADIFVPAALENQINAETAPLLDVRLVAEGANGPLDARGDEILRERGIDIIPDVLCNAGGVIVSYFEWLQNKRSEFWDLPEVDSKLKQIMTQGYDAVHQKVEEYETDWRTAAYILALTRLEKVYTERGIFP
jgi:glutamate dehydrogenase (NAD(P)+)